ncbi:VWA domain-containing protein [Kribbella sp. NBC_00482]|uniref:vWA domain-containing protein n=1 Tax=Kribbella sp. NBC_00482 TaxID=2975968 RepID=UPI002E19F444
MGQQVLPFYLVCDESGSMAGEPIKTINDALPKLHKEIGLNPVVSDKTQFSIIGFSDTAEVLLEMSDLSQVTGLPVLGPKGGTNFAAALQCVKEQIEQDVERLKRDGHKVYRPVVFFLTDGHANTDWKTEWQDLTADTFPYRPNIVAFGIGQADETTISAVATFKAFIVNRDMSPAAALQEFAVALTKSIVQSGSHSSNDGGMTLQTPDNIPGFTSLTVAEL